MLDLEEEYLQQFKEIAPNIIPELEELEEYLNHHYRQEDGFRKPEQPIKNHRKHTHPYHKKSRHHKKHYKRRKEMKAVVTTKPSSIFIPFTVKVKDIGLQKSDTTSLEIKSIEDFIDTLEAQYETCETELNHLKIQYPALEKYYYRTLSNCNNAKHIKLISISYKTKYKKDFKKSEEYLFFTTILAKNLRYSQQLDNNKITKKEFGIAWSKHTEDLQILIRKIFIEKKYE